MSEKEISNLSVMDKMVKEGNNAISMTGTLVSVNRVNQGSVIGFGVTNPIGDDAEAQIIGLPGKNMLMCFAIDRAEFDKTKQKIADDKIIISKTGIELIAQERKEQIEKHGWNTSNDVNYRNEELLKAALSCIDQNRFESPMCWLDQFRIKILNKSRIDQLKVAGALIAAEIDRIIALDDLEECTSCDQKFPLDTMESDSGGNWFCPECWKVLEPVMKEEYEELVRKGEIE